MSVSFSPENGPVSTSRRPSKNMTSSNGSESSSSTLQSPTTPSTSRRSSFKLVTPSKTSSTPTTTSSTSTPTTPTSQRSISTQPHDKSSFLSGSLIRKTVASAILIVLLITGLNFIKSSPSLRQVSDSSNDSVYGTSVFSNIVNKALFEISGTAKPSKF